ncbi:PadR family transcriptional regulator [Peribacillus sp. SCS-26]|uniref:PadR family transcriptional regulator n=1 Tax=Paraperibacillus marinus TaxID=3115295 RepID=UPI003905A7BE
MNDRLNSIKKAMKKTVFNNLTFTSEHKRLVHNRINSKNIKSDAELLIAVLQLLTQEKTGYELNQKIRARGIQNFDNDEGSLYMLLHRLEQKGCLEAHWKETNEKYYVLADKGSKLLRKALKESAAVQPALRELMEG